MLVTYLNALTRTYVPLAVAYVLTYVGKHFNIVLSDNLSQQATAAIVAGIFVVYYAAVKALESKYPALTWLLGSKTQPVGYTSDGAPESAAPVNGAIPYNGPA